MTPFHTVRTPKGIPADSIHGDHALQIYRAKGTLMGHDSVLLWSQFPYSGRPAGYVIGEEERQQIKQGYRIIKSEAKERPSFIAELYGDRINLRQIAEVAFHEWLFVERLASTTYNSDTHKSLLYAVAVQTIHQVLQGVGFSPNSRPPVGYVSADSIPVFEWHAPLVFRHKSLKRVIRNKIK